MRRWGLLKYHGPCCWWCCRMAAVKYAHLNTRAFNHMLEKEGDNKQEARVNAWVYLSMRQEGRVQITAAMLKTRLQMLRQACEELPPIWGSKCEATMLLQAFVAQQPEQNPVALNYAIVQLVVDGKKRAGRSLAIPCLMRDFTSPCTRCLHVTLCRLLGGGRCSLAARARA